MNIDKLNRMIEAIEKIKALKPLSERFPGGTQQFVGSDSEPNRTTLAEIYQEIGGDTLSIEELSALIKLILPQQKINSTSNIDLRQLQNQNTEDIDLNLRILKLVWQN